MATKKATPAPKATIDVPTSISVTVNGKSAAHELAALKLLEAEGYDLTKLGVEDMNENLRNPGEYLLTFGPLDF